MEHLEGRQSVLAALAARQRKFQVVLIKHGLHQDKIQDVLAAAAAARVPVRRVHRDELDALAHGASHGGVMAVCSAKPPLGEGQLVEMLQTIGRPLLLLIEGIEDARNLGFTVRTAEAFGAQAVLIKKHLWDFDAVEVGRPASGALERMPLVLVEDVGLLKRLRQRGIAIIGCLNGAKDRMYDVDLSGPVVLAIGGEKRGLSGAVRGICDRLMCIPTAGGASSLSLSHAAAIVLAEAWRQRGERHESEGRSPK